MKDYWLIVWRTALVAFILLLLGIVAFIPIAGSWMPDVIGPLLILATLATLGSALFGVISTYALAPTMQSAKIRFIATTGAGILLGWTAVGVITDIVRGVFEVAGLAVIVGLAASTFAVISATVQIERLVRSDDALTASETDGS